MGGDERLEQFKEHISGKIDLLVLHHIRQYILILYLFFVQVYSADMILDTSKCFA